MVFDTTKLTYLRNGSSLSIDPDKCTGCGLCIDVCPHAVLDLVEHRAVASAPARCMECGACRMNCPSGAIAVTSGVGCVAAIVNGMMNKSSPSCGCGSKRSKAACS